MRVLRRNILLLMVLMFVPGPTQGAGTNDHTDINQLWQQDWDYAATFRPSIRFPYQDCFEEAAQTYNIPLPILLALARGESNFKSRASSDKNCHGLMQIRWPTTANHLGITRLKDLFDPCINIRVFRSLSRRVRPPDP